MTRKLDLKSILIGGCLALLILGVLGAAPRLLSPDSVGRFAVALSDAPNGDVYVLDTVTGQVWPKYSNGRSTIAFYTPKLQRPPSEEPNAPKLKARKSQELGQSSTR
jgi:hypothetical protein